MFLLFTKILVFHSYIYYKIFVLLFCSLFILACSNDVSAPTTNITDVALHSLERSVSTKEGETFRFVFELNKASIKDVVFDWHLQHHSTSAGDFTGVLAGTKMIRAGSTTTDIVIDTSDDTIYEGNEGFALSIINVIGAVPNSLSVVASIIDKDQPIILFKQDSTALEGANFVYRLQLNQASVLDVSFDWFVQHHSTSTGDFTGALTGTRRIIAGSTTTDIVIDTSDDTIYEGDESFALSIINVIGATPDSLLVDSSIIDDKDKPIISFKQDSTALEAASLSYRLQLNKVSARDVSFDWSVRHLSTSTGDFTGALFGTKRIRAGSTMATISIDTSDDSIYEGNEIFSLNITNVIGATPDNLAASGSIIDNDVQPTIAFKQDYSSVTEGGRLSYTLRLINTSTTEDIAFDWYLQHSSTSAEDFTGVLAGTKRIRAGSTTATISIDTSDDSIYEGNEIFSLNIINVTGAFSSTLVASGRITDNDPQPTIFFEQVARSVLEGANFVYRLHLNQASAVNVSFDWSVQHSSTSAEDFRGALVGSQRITAGSTTTDIVIDTSNDTIYEGEEDFMLNITNVTGVVFNRLVASGRITDNDPQPTIFFEQVARSVLEGANFVYRLQLNQASAVNVSFDWFVQHLSTSAEDFRGAIVGSQRITAGSTTTDIVIDTSNDTIYEGDEDFILNITNVTGAAPNRLVASGSITDNDFQPTILFEQVARSVLEGARLSYILQLPNTSTTDVVFDWSVQHISTSAEDFTGALAGTKKIIVGSTTTDIVIDTSDDLIPELAEDFTLHITNIRGATPNSLSKLITIAESDLDTTLDYNGNGLIDIVTQEYFDNIRYNLAGTSYKTSTSDAGKTCGGNICRGYELLANLDLSSFANWQPIGSTSDPFTSILRGNAHSIANLVIDGGDYLGLFAVLSGATIDNLVVEAASISGDSYVGALAGRAENSAISRVQIRAASASSKLQATGARVGGMLGETIGTTITNITSDVSIVGGNNDNADYAGGIVGYVSSSNIRYAYSSGSVFASDGADNVGGLVGYMQNNSAISYSSTSSSVTSNGSDSWAYGGLVGRMENNSTISYSSASGSVTSNGDRNFNYGGLVGQSVSSNISYSSTRGSVTSNGNINSYYGGLVGRIESNSTISDSSTSASVTSNGHNYNSVYGGLVGWVNNSTISGSSASGNVISDGDNSNFYGGLAGRIQTSKISNSSASGSVSSNGGTSNRYGGLVGELNNSTISSSSASGNVISNGISHTYGGLSGFMENNSTIDHSSASGNVISSGANGNYYGGLVGESGGEVQHSWSSSSVFASNPAGLVGNNRGGTVGYSYALGNASYGLVATNTGTITNSYWNSETSGALAAGPDSTTNIASSDTAGMLASTGSAEARIFKGFFDATDELNRNIWTFTSGSYPVITELGIDEQAVSLAYGLLRLASPYAGVSNLDSFLGGTLNNEDIELIANSYNANNALAILDVNLLQSNSVTCAAGSGDTIMTTTGANGTTIALQKIAGSIEIEKNPSNSCEIIFSNQKTDGTLQLAAIISKGAASLSKKFEITLNTIQSIVALHPTTLSAREGDELVFTLELNHRARRDIIFDWSVQHSSTSTSDFTGAISGSKTILVKGTDATIMLQINDDDRPELAEDFTLHITNIRGATPDSLSTLITIAESDISVSVDYNGNGLIDIITQERLGNIRHNLAGTSYKTSASDAGTNCGGSACRGYELLGDLDLSSFANWQPIGSENDPFTSILQGNGYSIANLVIDGGNNIGLFATLSGATIDNLVVEVVSMTGDSDVGALAGRAENSAISRVQIRAASASSKLSATGARIGGILGRITDTTITNATSDLDVVEIGGVSLADLGGAGLGGIVGYAEDSSISHAYSSASISAGNLFHSAGGLVGYITNSSLSYSSASGSVSGSGTNENHGGLVGYMESSSVSYSSASGSVISSGRFGQNHGGLVGYMTNSSVSYSSASGNVIDIEAAFSFFYGGLVGYAKNSGKIIHSWSSSSVGATGFVAGLIGSNEIDVKFSYVLGTILPSGFGLVNTNTGTITNSYWNSETSGALEAGLDNTTNIASSDTAGMLASTGSAEARIFKGFFDATDEHNRNIWSFASGSYPIITELGVDKQAVSLAYGLLRLASPYAGVSNLDSFLGGTLNNENIELIANSYNANDTLAILDVNLLQSNSVTCAAGSGDTIMTTTGANGTTIALQKIAGSIEIEKSPSNSCEIIFSNQKTDGTLQLAAIISKGAASLTKKFEITLKNIQPIISLQPTTLSTSEGDELVFTLELNHRALRDISFAWSVQHSSTSASDFTGAISGFKTIPFRDTTATIELRINDDNLPESAETFTLSITNITGAVPDSSSASITILASDVDNNGNGLIDIVTQEQLGNIRYNLAGTSYKIDDSDAGVKCATVVIVVVMSYSLILI